MAFGVKEQAAYLNVGYAGSEPTWRSPSAMDTSQRCMLIPRTFDFYSSNQDFTVVFITLQARFLHPLNEASSLPVRWALRHPHIWMFDLSRVWVPFGDRRTRDRSVCGQLEIWERASGRT